MLPISSNVLELGADDHRVNDDRGSFMTWPKDLVPRQRYGEVWTFQPR